MIIFQKASGSFYKITLNNSLILESLKNCSLAMYKAGLFYGRISCGMLRLSMLNTNGCVFYFNAGCYIILAGFLNWCRFRVEFALFWCFHTILGISMDSN